MYKHQRVMEWDALSSSDQAYLHNAYERYKSLLEASPLPLKKIDSFHRWLNRRDISSN